MIDQPGHPSPGSGSPKRVSSQPDWQGRSFRLHPLRELEPAFLRLARKALALVTVEQADYWRAQDPVFFRLCNSGELEASIENAEQQIAGM